MLGLRSSGNCVLSFAARFNAIAKISLEAIDGVSATLCQRHSLAELLPQYFALLYAVQRATVPLIRLVLRRLNDFPDHPFERQVRAHFTRALEDERDHELMLLRDLETLGVSPELVTSSMPSTAITALVGSQYYLIEHRHPAVHLGYSCLLESHATTSEDVQRLIALSGAPEGAFSNYRLHAEVDGEHHDENEVILNAVPTDRLRDEILANSIRSADFICQALESLADQVDSRDKAEPVLRAEPTAI